MPSTNVIVIAAAGSRKTTSIVEDALEMADKKVLLLTYTIENYNQLRRYFIDRVGVIPTNITIQTWFTFLLQHMVRPYQNTVYDYKRIENIAFVEGISTRGIAKTNVSRYFFARGNHIYTDKISEFSCMCNEASGGAVISRLQNIYSHIFIDEVQDLAGYDFEILELLLRSEIDTTFVGDNRQATYHTNYSPKYANKFRGTNIIHLFDEWQNQGLCTIQSRNDCYRSNQMICDFADSLYPEMPKTISKNDFRTGHDGIFIVRPDDFYEYMAEFNPKVLRYNRRSDALGFDAINFGLSKGLTFDRIIILPTGGITTYIAKGALDKVGDVPKFYVAVTRAKYSVAIVHGGEVAAHANIYERQARAAMAQVLDDDF